MPQLIASIEGVQIKQLYLTQDHTTLGRREDNDIVLADLTVSSRHCVFELKGVAYVYVQDLGSTNGTFVNGRIAGNERLQDQDVLHIGRFKFQYFDASEPPLAVPSTMSMPLEGLEVTEVEQASLRVLSGSSAGLEIAVVKAVATFGQPGVAVVAIAHRRQGYFVLLVEGNSQPTLVPRLNGKPITSNAVQLHHHDVLEIAGTSMEFLLKV